MRGAELDRYLYLSGTTNQRFALLCGVSSITVYNWRSGIYSPSPTVTPRIKRAIAERNQELRQALAITEEGAYA